MLLYEIRSQIHVYWSKFFFYIFTKFTWKIFQVSWKTLVDGPCFVRQNCGSVGSELGGRGTSVPCLFLTPHWISKLSPRGGSSPRCSGQVGASCCSRKQEAVASEVATERTNPCPALAGWLMAFAWGSRERSNPGCTLPQSCVRKLKLRICLHYVRLEHVLSVKGPFSTENHLQSAPTLKVLSLNRISCILK